MKGDNTSKASLQICLGLALFGAALLYWKYVLPGQMANPEVTFTRHGHGSNVGSGLVVITLLIVFGGISLGFAIMNICRSFWNR